MINQTLKKAGITMAGFLLILLGIFLLVLPGPGILLILAGLAVLGTEYHWARRLVAPVREWLERRKQAAGQKKAGPNSAPPPRDDTNSPGPTLTK